jgi:UDP-N-acetylmuramoylalanine--D-glutamate ligase
MKNFMKTTLAVAVLAAVVGLIADGGNHAGSAVFGGISCSLVASCSYTVALAAAGLARTIGISHEKIREAITSFAPGKHRIEKVLEKDSITWINDSKATNPHAAAAALSTFESIIWVVGGLLKGVDISPLVKKYAPRVKAAIIIGADRSPVVAAFTEHAPQIPRFEITSSSELPMIDVIKLAKEQAQSGDVVLLAPAAASMDQFLDYEDRGNAFAKAIEQEVRRTNG